MEKISFKIDEESGTLTKESAAGYSTAAIEDRRRPGCSDRNIAAGSDCRRRAIGSGRSRPGSSRNIIVAYEQHSLNALLCGEANCESREYTYYCWL